MRVQIVKQGCVVKLDDEQAQRLVAQGYAVPAPTTADQNDVPRTLVNRIARKGCNCGGGCK